MNSQEWTEYLREFCKMNSDLNNNPHLIEYLKSLNDLSALIDDYCTLSERGYKKLGNEDLKKLRESYESVYSNGLAFKNTIKNQDPKDVNKARTDLIDNFEVLLSKDIQGIEIAPQKGLRTYPEILSDTRELKVEVDSNAISKSGENLSNRIPISYTNESGQKFIGFFTETEHIDKNKEMNELYNKAVNGHPEYDRAFRGFFQDPYFRSCFNSVNGVKEYFDSKLTSDNVQTIVADFLWQFLPSKRGYTQEQYAKVEKELGNYIDSVTKDEEFCLRFREFARGYGMISNKYDVLNKAAKIADGSNIGDRNAAMSEVAAMLDTPDLIARSIKMTLVVDGQEKDGTFMEFASGSDINSIKPGDPLNNLDKGFEVEPEALKNIADLQILDFICGNTDRHPGNMFYKLRDTENGVKLTGIVGIDNDCSMGTLDPSRANGSMQDVGSDNLMVISQEYADKISLMTPDMLDLRLKNLELSHDEIDAAHRRLAHIQKVIAEGKEYFAAHPDEKVKNGHLRIVKNDEWQKYSINELAYQEGVTEENRTEKSYGNYFSSVSNLPAVVKSIQQEKQQKKENEEKLKKINPKFVAEKGSFKIAPAKKITETNKVGIIKNRRDMETLHLKMKSVNEGFFIGSDSFSNIMKQFKFVKKLSDCITENSGSVQLNKLADEFKKLEKCIDVYLDGKKTESQEKQNKARSIRRVDFANDLKKYVDSRQTSINNTVHTNSMKLKQFLNHNGTLWESESDGKMATSDLKNYAAMAVARNIILEKPSNINKLGINDFVLLTEKIKSSSVFIESTKQGQLIDIKNITEGIKTASSAASVKAKATEVNLPGIK